MEGADVEKVETVEFGVRKNDLEQHLSSGLVDSGGPVCGFCYNSLSRPRAKRERKTVQVTALKMAGNGIPERESRMELEQNRKRNEE